MRDLSIPLGDLDQAPQHRSFALTPAWLKAALEGASDVSATDEEGKVDLELTQTGENVYVKGHVHATIGVQCARCLNTFSLRIEKDLACLMVPGKATINPETNEYEFSETEADTVPYESQTLVLDDFVRDEIVLEVPMLPLCDEACPGLAGELAAAGISGRADASLEDEGDRAIDPRLLPLKGIKLS